MQLSESGAHVLRVIKPCCTTMLYNMETTFSHLRAKLKSYCDQAVAQRQPIRVRRRKEGDVVLLAADEFDSLAATVNLLSTPQNAARLLEALARARRDKVRPMTVKKLRAAVGL
jgi:antitoxin YefM